MDDNENQLKKPCTAGTLAEQARGCSPKRSAAVPSPGRGNGAHQEKGQEPGSRPLPGTQVMMTQAPLHCWIGRTFVPSGQHRPRSGLVSGPAERCGQAIV